ncbi:MAG: hypothetical protein ACFFCQ_14290 [Promethearchaeota archaeon]
MKTNEINVKVTFNEDDYNEILLLKSYLKNLDIFSEIDEIEVIRRGVKYFFDKLLFHTLLEVVFVKARESNHIDYHKLKYLMSRENLEDSTAHKLVNDILKFEEKKEIILALAKVRKKHGSNSSLPFETIEDLFKKENPIYQSEIISE